MTEAKPTPGPWSVQEGDVWCDLEGKPNAPLFRQATEYRRWGRDISPSERTANAHLCAEAGTVYHETGLTPRELAEQRAEMIEAQERLLRRAESLIAKGKDLPFKPSFGMLVIAWLREVAKEGK